MKVAIASGKGGTGKTTVAVNLACIAARNGRRVAYLDCDVEEPNGHIFLKPAIDELRPIEKPIPTILVDRCTYCGLCARACRYGAIASLPNQTIVFSELCHSCGGCVLACPADAIREEPRPIGRLRLGTSGKIAYVEGEINIGEAMSPPAIRAVKAAAPPADLIILDAPPGTSCPVIETLRGCDRVILVTEPTPFGFYDLMLAVEMVRALSLPFSVVINRANGGNNRVRDHCAAKRIHVTAEIPDDRSIAEAYSRGEMISERISTHSTHFVKILDYLNNKEHP